MKRKRLFPSAFFNTIFVLLSGTLENGDHGVDAASFRQQQRQIDQYFDQKRSGLSWPDPPRGHPAKESAVLNMQLVDGVVPQNSVRVEGTSQLDINVDDDDETSVRIRRTRLKRRTHSSDAHLERQGKPESAYDDGVVVVLGEAVKNPNRSVDDAMEHLRQAFAHELDLPQRLVRVKKINFAGNVVELSFYRSAGDSGLDLSAVPASEIVEHPDLLQDIRIAVPDLDIQEITFERGLIVDYNSPFWMQPYFPYVVAGGCVLIVFVTGIAVYLWTWHSKESVDLTSVPPSVGGSQHLYLQPGQGQQVLYPDITAPDTGSPLTVQPSAAPVFVPIGFATTPVPTQPLRIKRKGLLESRRGSNASLTLDLQPSPEMGRWDGTPPKESTGLEFLMSAGNRLSRRDLRNAAKNTKVLYEEFWEIPMNHPEKVSVAGSGMKNRYKTIIPNENTRVVLPDEEEDPLSAYINANYIRGYEGEPRAYIATQGPMAHTIVDFWQMVWHQRCPIIVMITKLKEKSKPKCENYLPDHYGVYDDIEVTVVKVINKRGYVVRHLHLKRGGESRMLLHFWYTTWPDHKPPDSPSMLLELVMEVELRRYKSDGITPRGPVCVHCSAGIGRTGCFVAISIGIRQLREEHSVDVLGIVCGMRLDRGGMIQTHEQYDFAHQALLEYERTLGEPSIQSLTALSSDGH